MNATADTPIYTRKQAENATLKRITAMSEAARLEAERYAKVAEASAEYDGDIRKNLEKAEKAEAIIKAYVEANPEEVLGEKQSSKFGSVTVGYRKSAAKVVYDKDLSEDEILERLASGNKALKGCIQLSTKIDKKQLLNVARTLEEPELSKLGLEIVQDSKFFIK